VSVARIGIVGGGLMGRELAGRDRALGGARGPPGHAAPGGDLRHERGARAWFERVEHLRVSTGRLPPACWTTPTSTSSTSRPAPPARAALPRRDRGGKDFLGEKPFGIDLAAGRRSSRRSSERRLRPLLERGALLPGALLAYDTIRSGALES
jgi:hypothetical protein